MIDLWLALLLPGFVGVALWLLLYVVARVVVNLFLTLVEIAFGL